MRGGDIACACEADSRVGETAVLAGAAALLGLGDLAFCPALRAGDKTLRLATGLRLGETALRAGDIALRSFGCG